MALLKLFKPSTIGLEHQGFNKNEQDYAQMNRHCRYWNVNLIHTFQSTAILLFKHYIHSYMHAYIYEYTHTYIFLVHIPYKSGFVSVYTENFTYTFYFMSL